MKLIENLKWRYAAKKMTGEKVPDEKISVILDAVQLSASSYGLQPYTVVVVSNPEIKLKLQAAAYGQPQVGESSHILVFCVSKIISPESITHFIHSVAETRGMPLEALAGYEGSIQGTVKGMNEGEQQNWAAKQAYIALGTALVAAAEQHVDACPMEGFNRSEFDKILGLEEKGLMSAVIMPIGYRSAEDIFSGAKKVRKDKKLLFHMVH